MIIIHDGSIPKILTGEKKQVTRYLSRRLRVHNGCLYPAFYDSPLLKPGNLYGIRTHKTRQNVLLAPTGRIVDNPKEECNQWRVTALHLDKIDAYDFLKPHGYKRIRVRLLEVIETTAFEIDPLAECIDGVVTIEDFVRLFDKYRIPFTHDYRAYTLKFEYVPEVK